MIETFSKTLAPLN